MIPKILKGGECIYQFRLFWGPCIWNSINLGGWGLFVFTWIWGRDQPDHVLIFKTESETGIFRLLVLRPSPRLEFSEPQGCNCPTRSQWSARPRLVLFHSQLWDQFRDWIFLSLNVEPESESRFFWVSIARPSKKLKLLKSKLCLGGKVCCHEKRKTKRAGESIFFSKYGLIRELICKYIYIFFAGESISLKNLLLFVCFWGWGVGIPGGSVSSSR